MKLAKFERKGRLGRVSFWSVGMILSPIDHMTKNRSRESRLRVAQAAEAKITMG